MKVVNLQRHIQNHPDIENRSGLALAGMTMEEARRELEEPDDGQKYVYFYGRKCTIGYALKT